MRSRTLFFSLAIAVFFFCVACPETEEERQDRENFELAQECTRLESICHEDRLEQENGFEGHGDYYCNEYDRKCGPG